MVPTVPITSNNYIMVTFPYQITLPDNEEDLACESTYLNLITGIVCKFDTRQNAYPNSVLVELTLQSTQIEADNRIGFLIQGLKNPPTT